MNKTPLPKVWDTFLHLFIGAVFLLSGWTKAGHPSQFADHLHYRLAWFPDVLAWPATFTLALVELLLGAMLVTRFHTGFARKATSALLVIFILYLFAQIVLGNTAPCSCYGSLLQLHPLTAMGLDLLFMGGLFLLEKRARKMPSRLPLFASLCLALVILVGWTRTTAHFDGLLVRLQPGMVLPVLPSLHPRAINRETARLVILAQELPDGGALERVQQAFPAYELVVMLNHSPSTQTQGNPPFLEIKPDLASFFVKKYPTSFTVRHKRVETVWRGSLPPIP